MVRCLFGTEFHPNSSFRGNTPKTCPTMFEGRCWQGVVSQSSHKWATSDGMMPSSVKMYEMAIVSLSSVDGAH